MTKRMRPAVKPGPITVEPEPPEAVAGPAVEVRGGEAWRLLREFAALANLFDGEPDSALGVCHVGCLRRAADLTGMTYSREKRRRK
jgi:hypothetical protein